MAFNDQQILNAQRIITIGNQLGATQRDILTALATAMQESELTNMTGGDRDSAGLFQQRPSMGWGSYEQVTNPDYAIRTFFEGRPGNPGLFSIKGRASMTITQAAQAVQRSAFPDAYQKHVTGALQLMGLPGSADHALAVPSAAEAAGMTAPGTKARTKPDATALTQAVPDVVGSHLEVVQPEAGKAAVPVGAGTPQPPGADTPTPIGAGAVTTAPGAGEVFDPYAQLPALDEHTFKQVFDSGQAPFNADGTLATGRGAKAVTAALSYLGTPYAWGGNGREGVDCSGLIQQAYRSIGVELPRLSADQARAGTRIPLSQLQPGDLVGWDNSSRNVGADHIAMYAGNGMIVEAPRPGINVRQRHLFPQGDDASAWGVRLVGGK